MSSFLHVATHVGNILLNLVGGWDSLLSLLLALMGLDYISGIIVGCLGKSPHSKTGCLDSRSSFEGLMKKGLILMVLAVAAQVDATIDGTFVRATTAWFYIANEGLSVLENVTIAGVPMPMKLLKILGRVKQEDEDTPEDAMHEA